MKLLSVVYGVSNSGKSTTLINLYNLLIQEPQLASSVVQITQPFPSDIKPTMLNFTDNDGKDIKVGIASAGDTEGVINVDFEKTITCDIAFCAAKSYGITVETIETRLQKYSDIIVLPFYKVIKNNNQYPRDLAKEILILNKLRWNELVKNTSVFNWNL